MYIDNPKKLFEDLSNISTISTDMLDLASIGKENDLIELITIVENNKDALWDSRVDSCDGSILWDLGEACDDAPNPKESRMQLRRDSRKLKKIWDIIVKELNDMNIKID